MSRFRAAADPLLAPQNLSPRRSPPNARRSCSSDGLMAVYKGIPGFKAYSLLEVSPTEIMSVSVRETHAG